MTLEYSGEVTQYGPRTVPEDVHIPGEPSEGSDLPYIIRPPSFRFTAKDFRSYDDHRCYYLSTHPRVSRASLQDGGILWRLGIESVQPDVVLNGPGVLARTYGGGVILRNDKGQAFVDDSLSKEEVSRIIGRNVVIAAGANTTASNDALPTWWPDPDIFKESTFGAGWWSPAAENWYRYQRAKFLNGVDSPKTKTQWRTEIRNWDKRMRSVNEKTRAAAENFLTKYCG